MPNPPPKPLSVLVVDDLVDGAETLAIVLEMHGFAVTAVTSGDAALAACNAEPPDVVLLDLLMPGIDGWEVARRLGERNFPKPPLVVAVTGCGSEEDRRRAAEAGIGLVLLKPVEPAILVGMLNRFQQAIS